jgi:hypothetical protein
MLQLILVCRQGIQTMILRADSGSEFIEADQEDSSYILFFF